ncbi:FkbM family methyltransferase [Geomonas azotofigens]|uniref:FkbM family methyltransferase n=1 Tax=Geomonas azotofigens TaxID=2843196 RepID=UPI001C1037B0|nr:FkbM family methyltransferase [Geomonas azotofigens]MBU5612551.1 FkbM family methyltransferase [Geomonas azotofigens]
MGIINLLADIARHTTKRLRLALLRRKCWQQRSGAVLRMRGLEMAVTDGANFYMQYKDEFVNRIYHFDAVRPDPVIIDGGSNMGMSILQFKKVHPGARVFAFEPDPELFKILSGNLSRNNISDVQLVNAGLAAEEGETSFLADGKAGGQIADQGSVRVRMVRLSGYLDQPVDFLKLNIEGEELAVLTEAAQAGKLRQIRELVLEYHGWAGRRQLLGDILNLLDRQGYRYLVHDFDAETCFASKPPFRLGPDTTWFCLVYAKRNDLLIDGK